MILMQQFSFVVLIAYLGKTSFVLNKQKTDKAGRMLILDIMEIIIF